MEFFRTLDLLSAIALGLTSARFSCSAVVSDAMQYFPCSLVPTVFVASYLIMHAIIGARLALHAAIVDAGAGAER
jgi:hypothetical protein